MSPMISYAQNLEDVILWRALKAVKSGFYVDVGANDPELDSVTKWFYDQGWRGINIEPSSYWSGRLNAQRHRDVNVQAAVSDATGEMTYFEVVETGLSTLDPVIAERYKNDKSYRVQEKTIPVQTLTQVLQTHLPEAISEIHFLKVDVEGLETAVIQGLDFQRYRPWVMVIESTLPLSQHPSDRGWSSCLLDARYIEAYFDGLNTFYVSSEHLALLVAFKEPPNIFDDYVSSKVVALELALEESRTWGRELDQLVNELSKTVSARDLKVAQLEAQHKALDGGSLHLLLFGIRHMLDPLWAWGKQQKRLLAEQGFSTRLKRFVQKIRRILLQRQGFHLLRKLPPVVKSIKEPRKTRTTPFNVSAFPLDPILPMSIDFLKAQAGGRPLDQILYRFFGHISGNYSLSRVNRAIALALEDLCPGRVMFSPYHGGAEIDPESIPLEQAPMLHAQIARWREHGSKESTSFIVSISHHYPLTVDPEPADLRLAVFFWEETLVPSEMVAKLNDHFDAVLVASFFVQSALRNSGCHLPIFVVPLGVDHVLDIQPAAWADPCPGKFIFLHVSSCFPRKGVDVLLKAYFESFSGNDDVLLYIKTFPNCHNDIKAQIAEISSAMKNPPAVMLDEEDRSDAEMRACYEMADAVVLPTRGEGFNLPAAEALALGVPLIVTGYGAQMDFAGQSHASLIPFVFTRSQSHVQSEASCWVNPDTPTLGLLMKSVMADRQRRGLLTANKCKQGQSHVRDVYRWNNSAALIQSVIEYSSQIPPKNSQHRIALISSWNCRCGIAEYARNLVSEFGPRFTIDVYCDGRSVSSRVPVVKAAWSLGEPDSVLHLLRGTDFSVYDVILVQHQPSLFELTPGLCGALASLDEAGVLVVLELHATGSLVASLKGVEASVLSLRRLSRIVVHSVDGMNDLLNVGLVENVMLLPHGVPDVPDSLLESVLLPLPRGGNSGVLLGTFGFALPHKGVDQLILALPGLRRRFKCPVSLLAITSSLDERSAKTVSEWQALADSIGVSNCIRWVTNYQDEATCLSMLATCDLLVFPYRETGDSASGAVTVGLASMRPVVVSRAGIFSEWRDCTVAIDGYEAIDIERTVVDLLESPEKLTDLSQKQRQWLKSRSWKRVSKRFKNLLLGLTTDQAVGAVRITGCATHNNQLLVDVSALIKQDGGAGIKRVVRSLLAALDMAPPIGYVVRPVYSEDGVVFRYTGQLTPANPDMVLWDENPVRFFSGDVFLGLDLTAHLFPAVQPLLRRMRDAGVHLAFVLHDILPLTQPTWFPPGVSGMFQTWLSGLAECAHQIISVSRYSGVQVSNWISDHHPSSLVTIGTFRLGTDLNDHLEAPGFSYCDSSRLEKLCAGPIMIAVGTVEIRKGYDDLLDAFELLWEAEIAINLVIIGKPGWHADSVIRRAVSHNQLEKRLLWLSDASDSCLQRCYKMASGLVAASYDEGFGLPLIEAARFDLPVIARDIPVFHEVLGDYARYFSGGAAELAGEIRSIIADKSSGERLLSCKKPEILSWAESKDLLLSAIGLNKT